MALRVADVLRSGAREFLSRRSVAGVVEKACRAVMACRTAALGGHAEVCADGHTRVWYNACRHRACPRCSYYRVQRWLERQARILLGCAHHHVIFTIPHELNVLWPLNQGLLGDLLFKATRDSLFTLAADPRYLGAQPGALLALHTWGQQLALHPHVHCLVTAGGVDEEGHWRACRRRHFLPAEPLKQLFRGKYLAGLCALVSSGRVRLPTGWSAAEVYRLCKQLRHKRWNVHVRERYQDPTAVLNYLGRYLHGGPIGESRLLAFDGASVSFRYKDYRLGAQRAMTLSTPEFIRRYLQHVPPKGFHMVRGFGLYRRGSGRAAQLHPLPLAPELHAALTAHPAPPPRTADGRTPCLQCGKPIVLRTTLTPFLPRPRPGPTAKVA